MKWIYYCMVVYIDKHFVFFFTYKFLFSAVLSRITMNSAVVSTRVKKCIYIISRPTCVAINNENTAGFRVLTFSVRAEEAEAKNLHFQWEESCISNCINPNFLACKVMPKKVREMSVIWYENRPDLKQVYQDTSSYVCDIGAYTSFRLEWMYR
jgi:hypothetical protein